MALESLRAFLLQPRVPKKLRDWDASRSCSLDCDSTPAELEERLRGEVLQMHWISQLCFLEQGSPQHLLLRPELLARVTQELKRLETRNPLEVATVILELGVGVPCESGYAEEHDTQAV
jgi:hypothetical protein